MINNLTVTHPPPPPEEYRTGSAGTRFFPVARWIEHRSWIPHQNVVYQNLTSALPKKIPWQVGRATTATLEEAKRVRRSMAAVPASERLRRPAYGGVGPEVVAVVEGPTNPWFGGPLSRTTRMHVTRGYTRKPDVHKSNVMGSQTRRPGKESSRRSAGTITGTAGPHGSSPSRIARTRDLLRQVVGGIV
jgi:hypothetical protein